MMMHGLANFKLTTDSFQTI